MKNFLKGALLVYLTIIALDKVLIPLSNSGFDAVKSLTSTASTSVVQSLETLTNVVLLENLVTGNNSDSSSNSSSQSLKCKSPSLLSCLSKCFCAVRSVNRNTQTRGDDLLFTSTITPLFSFVLSMHKN